MPLGVDVPHEQARALRFLDGGGLRFARAGDYELHPEALLRPLELSEQSTGVLEALVRPAPQEQRPAAASESPPARAPAQPLTAPRRPESELDPVGFSNRTRNLLGRLQLSDLQQLAECTEKRLRSVPGAGAGTLQEIQSKLAEHGLELAVSPAAPRYPDERIAEAESRARRMVMLRGEGLTLAEIGQQHGLSLERVRRILARSGAPDKAQAAEARSRSIRDPVQPPPKSSPRDGRAAKRSRSSHAMPA